MAIKKCKECGKDVSTKAKTCPHCGVNVKKSGIGCFGYIGLFLLIGIPIGFINILTKSESSFKSRIPKEISQVKTKKSNESPAKKRKKRIEAAFSPWDGSHRFLERSIKRSMNDPDSYDHISTTYLDKGKYLIVKTTFRGKNAFGALVINSVTAKTDLDGNVLEIISEEP
jgi:hypothetical protein